MKKVLMTGAVVALLALAGASAAEAAGTAMVAQRSYSDQDLKKYIRPPAKDAAPVQPAGDVKKPEAVPAPEAKGRADREYWCSTASAHRRDADQLREALARAEEELRLANDVILYQKQINETTLAAQTKARENVEETKRQLQSSEQRLRDLGEEARSKDIPPGWLECHFE